MKKRRINSIIRKSFFRDGRMSIALVSIVMVCSFIIAGFSGLISVTSEKHQKEAEERYGSYQFGVKLIPMQQAKEIANKEFCAESAVFTSEYIQYTDLSFYRMYVEDSFWDISDLKLISGKFPKFRNELVCNEELLNSLGYDEGDIGKLIRIGNEEYTLTGIITDAAGSGENTVALSLDEKAASNNKAAVMIRTHEKNYGKFMDAIEQEYGLQSIDVFENGPVIQYAEKDIYGRYIGIMKVFHYLCYLVIFPCVMLTVIVAVFYGRKIAPLCNQYMGMGISRMKLYVLFVIHIFEIIIGLSFIITALVFIAVLANLNSINIEWNYIFAYMAKEFITVILFYSVSSFVISAASFGGYVFVREGKRAELKKDKVKESTLLNSKDDIYTRISMENMNFGNMRHFFVVIMLAVICIMAAGSGYFMEQYVVSHSVTDKYDYFAEFQYEDFAEEMEGSDENKKIYENLLHNKNIKELLPLYLCHTDMKVDKKQLDEGYLEYLAKTSEYYAEAIEKSSAKLYVPVMVIKEDEELLKKYGITYNTRELGENECIILRYTSAPGLHYGYETGIGMDTPLYYNFGSDDDLSPTEDVEFQIKEIVEEYDVSLFQNYYTQIMIVNSEQYRDFIPYDYPDFFYVKAGNKEETSKILEGSKRLEVTDFQKERSENKEYNQMVVLTRNIIFTLVLMMMSIVMGITAYIGFCSMKKQSATLYAIGIPDSKISKIFTNDIVRIYENMLMIAILASGAVTYYIYSVLGDELYFYQYSIPWGYILIPVVLVGIASLIVSVIIRFIIKRMDVIKILNDEVNEI